MNYKKSENNFIESIISLIITIIQITIFLLILVIGFSYYSKFKEYNIKQKLFSVLSIFVSFYLVYLLDPSSFDEHLYQVIILILGAFLLGFSLTYIADSILDNNIEQSDDIETRQTLLPLYITSIVILSVIIVFIMTFFFEKNTRTFDLLVYLIIMPLFSSFIGLMGRGIELIFEWK
jgi:hypothetical protein